MPGKSITTRKKTASSRRKTKWQLLLSAKAKHCKGSITKTALNKAAKAYVTDTVKKGNKTKSEAEKAANKLINGSCAVGIAGAKKKRNPAAKAKTGTTGRKKTGTRTKRKTTRR